MHIASLSQNLNAIVRSKEANKKERKYFSVRRSDVWIYAVTGYGFSASPRRYFAGHPYGFSGFTIILFLSIIPEPVQIMEQGTNIHMGKNKLAAKIRNK